MVDIKVEHLAPNESQAAQSGVSQPTETDLTDKVWDEEQLEQSLKSLKEMYIQLRDLRSAIPKLVAPLAGQQGSPEILFRKFKVAATTTNDDLKQFRRLMEAEGSQKIFDHAKESRAENPKNISAWKVTEHPDWYSRDS